MSLPKKYATFVDAGTLSENKRNLMTLSAMGLAGEAGEVCDLLKKHLFHRDPLNRDDLKKELGDVLWYLQLACNVFDIPMGEVAQANIIKCCDRYPDRYGEPADWYTE